MRDNITGKSILLIGDPFYGYCGYIRDQLIVLGAKSVCLVDRPFYPGSFRDSIDFSTFFFWLKDPKARTHWTNNLIKTIEKDSFDTLFVVEKMPFKKSFISYLRNKKPHIRTILFLWDTFQTQQSRYIDFLPLFDKVYTFDRDDATRYKLSYYPDFYIEINDSSMGNCIYDISFIGTMTPKSTLFRGELLAKISELCRAEGLNCFFYLRYIEINYRKQLLYKIYNKIKYWKYSRNLEKLKDYDFMHSTAMPLCEYNHVLAHSKAVLDISHRNRQGMTVNAITAIAHGKKLITTNYKIKDEPFYDPQMIHIIDENNPIIDFDFLRSSSRKNNLSYLRIDNWLKHIVNEM